MKKKKFIRFSKRLLILLLCTSLLSGTLFNKQKMTVQATSIVASLSAYTLYEICMYVGYLILGCTAIGGVGYLLDNRDEVARVGKDFIDNTDLDELSEWVLFKAGSVGQSYVFGSEAFQTVKDTSFEVIQGGGNSPENNEDNDGDGDKDFDDRTKELEQMGMWGTATFVNWFCERMEELMNKNAAGEETFLNAYYEASPYDGEFFTGYVTDANGYYIYNASAMTRYPDGKVSEWRINSSKIYRYPSCFVKTSTSGTVDTYRVYEYRNGTFVNTPSLVNLIGDFYTNGVQNGSGNGCNTASLGVEYKNNEVYAYHSFSVSFPVFSSMEAAEAFFATGDLSGCINLPGNYQIADWLQEDWKGVVEALNTGIRSLTDNMTIVGAALNQAINNQLDGLGYIGTLTSQLANAIPLSLPAGMADPLYYPNASAYPAIDPSLYPWAQPNSDPDSGTGSGSGSTDDGDLDPKSKFGLNTIFGILILLIMIIIMLLVIFISCLAFIVMVFRIKATTGFLPEEMVAGLDYLKSLEIPGFGMSVYSFFMALIYILLFFSIVGILRKNIDKIKFPRKGGR